jgi:hypothetical protein
MFIHLFFVASCKPGVRWCRPNRESEMGESAYALSTSQSVRSRLAIASRQLQPSSAQTGQLHVQGILRYITPRRLSTPSNNWYRHLLLGRSRTRYPCPILAGDISVEGGSHHAPFARRLLSLPAFGEHPSDLSITTGNQPLRQFNKGA